MKWYQVLWELPQTLLGCIVQLFLTEKKDKWGWLYLIVVGIPSIRNNLKARTCE